ncbi:hypothetical protein VitviT2T_015430 [Vitis vinifera]|nr:hypothetical protein VitviT2T_015430 [Vitis vinifera]
MVLYFTGTLNIGLTLEHKVEVLHYINNHQNEDGGWGFHIEGHSTMLGTTLNYISMRILGVGPDDKAVAAGRKWILDHGGATYSPSWGKCYLSVFGLYEWSGCNPLPPEFWLFPSFLPMHPDKMWCYSRTVYMPMSYLYGTRFQAPITDLVLQLREEMHTEPYHEIDWAKARILCAKEDYYYPHSLIQDVFWGALYHFGEPILKRWPASKIRETAVKKAIEIIHWEDENSRYMTPGCVHKAFHMMAVWAENPDSNSDAFKHHLARIPDYLWLAEDGMKVQSFGSQLWDTSFCIQAILESGMVEEYGTTLKKGHDFVKLSQCQENPSGDYRSRQIWEFDPEDGTPEEREEVRKVQENFTKNRFRYKPNGDLLMRMQLIKENQIDLSIPPVRLGENEEVTCEVVTTAVRKSVRLNRAIQAKDGHWPVENAGPLFFTPPLIMVLYFTGTLNFALTPEHIVLELLRYITNHQNEDGGWGFHIDGYSTMLGTTVSYISMHILGVGPDDKALAAGRKWILDRGGATYSPSWGKCYISVFGLYEWSGCNPLPPEFWLFPSFFPMHLVF